MYSVYVQYIFSICSVYVQYIFSICSVYSVTYAAGLLSLLQLLNQQSENIVSLCISNADPGPLTLGLDHTMQ